MIPERIASKIGPPDGNGCWPWLAAKSPGGYGVTYLDGRTQPAHRVVLELTTGEVVPPGMQVDHLCFNRACVNPAHHEVVTPEENKRRIRVRTNGRQLLTHCPQGHPYEGANLYVRPDGTGRGCQTCRSDAARRFESKYVRRRSSAGRWREARSAA